VKHERSAGGLVVRDAESGEEIAVVTPRAGVTALPKGHPEPGESLEQAALREVREEVGIVAGNAQPLGEVGYWYTLHGERIRKTVAFFLCRYLSGSVDDHDDEVIAAGWIPLAEAPDRLSYRGESEMAAKALTRPRTG
jgi:8-oxo-dGTP pyrophosphatase MutT (NUDIX family)